MKQVETPRETWEISKETGETIGETYGEMRETRRELPLREFLTHLVLSRFIYCRINTHGILCKIYLNGGWWRVQISYFCLVISWKISCPHLDIRNAIKCLNIWFIFQVQKVHVTVKPGQFSIKSFTNLGNDS